MVLRATPTRSIVLASALAGGHLLAACSKPRKSDDAASATTLLGASVSEIDSYEKTSGQALVPAYGKLYDQDTKSGRGKVRAALFFIYDREGVVPEGGPGRAPEAEDLATKAFEATSHWAWNADDETRSFLRGAVQDDDRKDGVTTRLLTGRGPAVGGLANSMDWEITLYRGEARALAPLFGTALARNHIAMLNGHFFVRDATAAEQGGTVSDPTLGSSTSTAQNNAANGPSGPGPYGPGPYGPGPYGPGPYGPYGPNGPAQGAPGAQAGTPLSKIYGPAMDAFRAAAGEITLGARVVVFNGCYSDEIEDLVVDAAHTAHIDGMSLIAMRGRSNYRFFGRQIGGFLNRIVTGEKWTALLDAFEVVPDPTASSAPPPASQRPGVSPVLRRISQEPSE